MYPYKFGKLDSQRSCHLAYPAGSTLAVKSFVTSHDVPRWAWPNGTYVKDFRPNPLEHPAGAAFKTRRPAQPQESAMYRRIHVNDKPKSCFRRRPAPPLRRFRALLKSLNYSDLHFPGCLSVFGTQSPPFPGPSLLRRAADLRKNVDCQRRKCLRLARLSVGHGTALGAEATECDMSGIMNPERTEPLRGPATGTKLLRASLRGRAE